MQRYKRNYETAAINKKCQNLELYKEHIIDFGIDNCDKNVTIINVNLD